MEPPGAPEPLEPLEVPPDLAGAPEQEPAAAPGVIDLDVEEPTAAPPPAPAEEKKDEGEAPPEDSWTLELDDK